MQDKIREVERKYRISVDDYNATVNVTVCFSHAVLWDDNSKSLTPNSSFTPGRRMDTSPNNPVSPEKTVTPDIVILKEKTQGIIAEIKQGLSRNNGNWDKVINQLAKYDDNLKGWRGVESEDVFHDLVLLIPYRFSVDFSDYLAKIISENKKSFARNLACISYTREDKASTFCTFQKVYGKISDSEKNQLFHRIYSIPMERVCPLYPMIFCDQDPPVPYTMDRIWGHLVNYKQNDVLDIKKGKEIVFTIEMVVDDLKQENAIDSFDDRTPELPRTSWIREALNEMTSLKIINKDRDTGAYSVSYHKYERMKNPLDTFIQKLAESEVLEEQAQAQQQQLKLPF